MKRIIITILFGYIVSNSFGQFYIQPTVGYTFSSHPAVIQSVLTTDYHKTVYEAKLKYGSGINLDLNLGYCFSDKFLVELDVKKSVYSSYKVSVEQPDLQSLNSFSFYGYFGDINLESSILQITPLIGYQVRMNLFRTYVKFGPGFLKSKINQTLKHVDWELDNWEFYPMNTVQVYEYSGKLNMGFQANLGFCYSIRPNLELVLDFVTVYNNYKITKAKIKYYEIDGVSHLYKFEDTNIDIDDDNNRLNHSNYGINAGIRYIFNKN